MKTISKLGLHAAIAMFCLGNVATAGFLDLTDNSVVSGMTKINNKTYEGVLDGVDFTLTSTPGDVTFFSYDGQGACFGSLACGNDGAGISGGTDNDEIDGPLEILTITFDAEMSFSSVEFLDLYKNSALTQAEQAIVTIDGAQYIQNATHSKNQINGGYAKLNLAGLVTGTVISFSGVQAGALNDDSDNDYSLAALTASAIPPVPVPAAVWLFGTALIGFIGMSRRTRVS